MNLVRTEIKKLHRQSRRTADVDERIVLENSAEYLREFLAWSLPDQAAFLFENQRYRRST